MTDQHAHFSRRDVLRKGTVITGTVLVGGIASIGTAAAGIGEGRIGDYHLNNIRPDGTVTDASPKNNHGTNHGPTVKRGDGQVGNALWFNGAEDHVYVGDVGAADGTDTLTLAAWIHPDTTDQGDFFTKNTSGNESNSSWVFRYSGNGDRTVSAHFNDDSDNWTAIRSESAVPTDSFTHVAVTLDGSTRRLYIDGDEDASDDYSGELDDEDAPVVLGAANQQGGGVTNAFEGMLDEVRMYDRALSADEIESLANMGGK